MITRERVVKGRVVKFFLGSALAASALLLSGMAQATTYFGEIARVQVQPSPSAPTTQTRVSIFTSSAMTTACTAASLYSFDLSNAAASEALQRLLLAALTHYANVTIDGTGSCDSSGIETVADISMYQPPI